jgi:hypothetical protein
MAKISYHSQVNKTLHPENGEYCNQRHHRNNIRKEFS